MILENASAFSWCGADSRKLFFNVLLEEREVRDPAGEAEEALIPPRGKQVLAAEINGFIYNLTSIYGKQPYL
ncbi:hypothetical protein [Bacillus sp. NTK034]|uniref:hypothetical protein n=1 Tax=Bacillus sp. NTK034 TaxID=2802176 RepID=UPI001A90A312|nr:hypothetical protein [Bacillus sp. NTK034]MBN8201711.1 hypothetical protein [Bacillus sp. NTK034]